MSTARASRGPAGAPDGPRRALATLPPPPSPAAVDRFGRPRVVPRPGTGLGILDELLANPDITEVMINGPGPVWIEDGAGISHAGVDLDQGTLDHLVERLLGPIGRRVDRASPLVDGRLADGSRVHVVARPLAVDGPYVTIRRFRQAGVPLGAMGSAPVVDLLARAVRARCNIVVSGATSSGKTTLLNALASEVAAGERIVTIEDAAELRLEAHHVVRLEARGPSVDGPPPVSIRELVRAALRMRPDRILVGEVRGAEALDMVQAMNTGHDGSLSTCHANSAVDALGRLEVMVLTADVGLPLAAVRSLVWQAVDLVVHLERGVDGRRRVADVVEVPARTNAEPRVLARGDAVVGELRRDRRPTPSEEAP